MALKTAQILKLRREFKRIYDETGSNNFLEASETFLQDPNQENLLQLENYANLEKKLCTRSVRNKINACIKESEEFSFSHCRNALNSLLNKLPLRDPVRDIGRNCLIDIQDAKLNKSASTQFLIDKLSVIEKAISKPLIYGRQLEEKTKEVERSNLRMLAGGMCLLASVLLLGASIYFTLQTAFAAWPITLETSKASFALMGVGVALIAGSGVLIAKSSRFFRSSIFVPPLRKSMENLDNQIKNKI